jgi:hypothetical protein
MNLEVWVFLNLDPYVAMVGNGERRRFHDTVKHAHHIRADTRYTNHVLVFVDFFYHGKAAMDMKYGLANPDTYISNRNGKKADGKRAIEFKNIWLNEVFSEV